KPRPLLVPVTFTASPTANTSTLIVSPRLYDGISILAFPGSSSRTLRRMRGGMSSPAFLAWPIAARLARCPLGRLLSPFADSRRSRALPSPSWSDAWPTLALSVTPSTGLGGASITVTGICCPCSLKIWVMPSFLPMMPIMLDSERVGRLTWDVERSCQPYASSCIQRPTSNVQLFHLDLHVDARRQIQLGQRVHRLGARIEDVDHALVCLELELFARLLVDVRRPEDRPPLRLRRQRNRAGHLRARLLRRPHDVRRRLIDHRVIEGFETDSDSACHRTFLKEVGRWTWDVGRSCQLMAISCVHLPTSNVQRVTPESSSPRRRRPSGRLRESRTAPALPSRSARSARSSSGCCRPA